MRRGALDAGYEWLFHYSSVDPLHDIYGIEVCGIHEQSGALRIRDLLLQMFPNRSLGEWKVAVTTPVELISF
jgi:hypothetical protein